MSRWLGVILGCLVGAVTVAGIGYFLVRSTPRYKPDSCDLYESGTSVRIAFTGKNIGSLCFDMSMGSYGQLRFVNNFGTLRWSNYGHPAKGSTVVCSVTRGNAEAAVYDTGRQKYGRSVCRLLESNGWSA
jgi:uncharacterized protein (DUF2062 family)